MALLAAALLIPGLLWAGPNDCQPHELGCVYVPAEPKALLVYFRGHWGAYKGNVPQDQLLASARQAFSRFELRRVADEAKAAVLVIGSSHLPVIADQITALERELKVRFESVSFAAHSGGNAGLSKSLLGGRRPDRVVMLDNFYFEEKVSKDIQALVFSGTVCVGFLTPHNHDRWQRRFQPHVSCPIDRLGGSDHDEGVVRCLGKYLRQTSCL